MGDEGVGVYVARHLSQIPLAEGVQCLDGGTGSMVLLEPMQQARKIILIDATVDDQPVGTISRLQPRFSQEYPRTLTAHDIGLKDLLDALYLLGDTPDVTLFAISIAEKQSIGLELSAGIFAVIPQVARLVLQELDSIWNSN